MTGKAKKPLMDHDPLEWVNDVDEESKGSISATEGADEQRLTESGGSEIKLEESEKMDHLAELHEMLLQALDNSGDIIIDASSVMLIDAAALQLLVLCFQQAIKQGQAVTIIEPSQSFSEAAGLLGLSELFGL